MNCGVCDSPIDHYRSEIVHHDATGRPIASENVCRPCFGWAYITIEHLSAANLRRTMPNVVPFRLPSADPHANCTHPPLHA